MLLLPILAPIRLHHSCSLTYSSLTDIYMRLHLPFSIQGLFFLSGAWISGSVFSFSSMYSFMLKGEENLASNQVWFTLDSLGNVLHNMRPATSFSRLRSLSDRGNLRKEFYEETPLPQQLDVFPSLLIPNGGTILMSRRTRLQPRRSLPPR